VLVNVGDLVKFSACEEIVELKNVHSFLGQKQQKWA
jgi:hypothetical protein